MREMTAGVPCCVTSLEVVHHVVDELRVVLGQGIAVVGVGEHVMVPRVGTSLSVRTKLLTNWIGDDRVLHGDILRAHAVDVIPFSELDGHLVEDQVVGVVQVESALASLCVEVALAEANVPYNVVRCTVKGDLAAHDANANARCSLSVNSQIASYSHRRGQLDISAHIEVDDTVALAYRIPKRADSRVVKVGDVVDRAGTAACRVAAEANCTWERHC